MAVAYVDTSVLVAIGFKEDREEALSRRLADFDELMAANLLEAELRAAHAREDRPMQEDLLAGMRWVIPDRPIGQEMIRVLGEGYLKGADLWHVAVALFIVEDPAEITFVTLDERQREVAARLGFLVWTGSDDA